MFIGPAGRDHDGRLGSKGKLAPAYARLRW